MGQAGYLHAGVLDLSLSGGRSGAILALLLAAGLDAIFG